MFNVMAVNLLKLLDGYRRAAVKHGVTVRANWNQVCNRVNAIVGSELTDRCDMMNMNEASPSVTIPLGKIEITDNADTTILGQTSLPSCGVALVAIYEHLSS
mgnify:CR=1 FL=1